MKKASLPLLVLFISAVLSGCSEKEVTSLRPSYQKRASDSFTPSMGEERRAPEGSILCQIRSDTLSVTHQDAFYQCCLEAKILVHKSGYTLDIVEYDVGQSCDCMCTFDLTTHIVGLPPGAYHVQVWGETGQFCGECVTTIPAGGRLTGFTQGECHDYPKTTAIESVHDSIGALFRDETLFVAHYEAFYNRCHRIGVELEQSGTVLNFIEHPTGELCRCMCTFNIVSTVTGLTPGAYVVRVWNDDRSILFGEVEVTVSPGVARRALTVPDEPPDPGRRWWYRSTQRGCKEVPKSYRSTKTNSYRMHRNVHGLWIARKEGCERRCSREFQRTCSANSILERRNLT